MDATWWYAVGDERRGPVPAELLEELLRKGQVGLTTLVWKPGMPQWVALREVAELRAFETAQPPGLPEPSPPYRQEAWRTAGPWRRFFARLIDIYALIFPTAFALAYVAARNWPEFSPWLQQPGNELVFGFTVVPATLFVEAVIFGATGSTLGKVVLAVRVRTVAGGQPDFGQYAHRMAGVYFIGLGLGLPVIGWAFAAAQGLRLGKGKPTAYDEGKFVVEAKPLGFLRFAGASMLVVILVLVGAGLNTASQQSSNTAALRQPETAAPSQGPASPAVSAEQPSPEAPRFDASTAQLSAEPRRSPSGGLYWTNPATGLTAILPSGWEVSTTVPDEQGNSVPMFTNGALGVATLLAHEPASASMSLVDYAVAWRTAVVQHMTLDAQYSEIEFVNHAAVTGTGTMTGPGNVPLTFMLLRGRDGEVWRTVELGNVATHSIDLIKMRLSLLPTI